MNDLHEPRFRVRARHTDSTITVYQAYRREIGVPAARLGRFPSAWKRERMTWVIKPRSQTPTRRPVLVRHMPVGPETQLRRMSKGRVGGSGSRVEAGRQRGLNLIP
ncbi:DUF4291 family protein [Streptomyces sp. SID5643]|nr:DUF4291 family protein [Streptomyces sp. SID5643]